MSLTLQIDAGEEGKEFTMIVVFCYFHKEILGTNFRFPLLLAII